MRLPHIPGEWIDRATDLTFQFEGQQYHGHAGDSISSALLAAHAGILGRSFKYHRPRSVLSMANHDVNAVCQWGDRPNVRSDVTALRAGMSLSAVNTFGGLKSDKARHLGLLSRFMPVGFYYKSFHSKKLFPMWERMFRALTGLGRVDLKAPRLRSAKRYDFCDVLVIGAGPSGLAAALCAAEQGAQVVIVDENAQAGGSGAYALGGNASAASQHRQELERVLAHPAIRLLTATYAAGYYSDHWIPLVDGEVMTKMRAKSVVVASGAYEQPAVFRNNDLPGVMLASAAQRLIYRYAVAPMKRALVLTANQDGYRAALDLLAHGIKLAAVLDLRAQAGDCAEYRELRAQGVRLLSGYCIVEALPGAQGKSVCGAVITRATLPGDHIRVDGETVDCDGILMSVGWAPTANLLYQAGGRMRYEKSLEQFVPDTLPDGVYACGRVNGAHTLSHRRLDGQRAGSAAAAHAGYGQAQALRVPPEHECPSHPWPIVSHPKGKNFVDFDEDLQVKDLENAAQEGFDSSELMKRYSTVGMGP